MKESIIKNVVLKDCASSTRNSGYCFTAILAKFNYGKISNCAISGGTSSTTSGNNSGTTMLCIENYGITENCKFKGKVSITEIIPIMLMPVAVLFSIKQEAEL